MGDIDRDPRRVQLTATFNDLAATYDQLHFLRLAATRLVEVSHVRAGARALDVGTGTGVVALAAAHRVGPEGRVIGVDLAPEMLAQAREKARAENLNHVEFREGEAEHLDLPDESVDVVFCAAALFFIPDMLAAVREFRRVLVRGGLVAFSTFGPDFLQPLRGLWEARLGRYGLAAAALPTHRLASPDICEALLREAGFSDVAVQSEQLGYYLPTVQARWADIAAGIEGKPLLELDPTQREQVREEHLAELGAVATSRGWWVDVPALFAFGRVPEGLR